jgi:predicted DNA-binding protein (MmcQ/YjbR family)
MSITKYSKMIREIAFSFPETTEESHFDKTSFRIKKKIFATFDENTNQACLKLPEIEQSVFSTIDSKAIFPVPNKWGKQGWTFFKLDEINESVLADALKTAYCTIAPKKLAGQIK